MSIYICLKYILYMSNMITYMYIYMYICNMYMYFIAYRQLLVTTGILIGTWDWSRHVPRGEASRGDGCKCSAPLAAPPSSPSSSQKCTEIVLKCIKVYSNPRNTKTLTRWCERTESDSKQNRHVHVYLYMYLHIYIYI